MMETMDTQLDVTEEAPVRGYPLIQETVEVEVEAIGLTFRHAFRPIDQATWCEYSDRLAISYRGNDDRIETDSATVEAAVWLWSSKIVEVSGYGDLPNRWAAKIPVSHRLAAVVGLQQVAAVQPDDGVASDFFADERVIELEATIGGVRYEGLRHRFRRPTETEEIAYEREMARSSISRKGKAGEIRTHVPSRLKYLCDLYDELIIAVEGYEQVDGVDLKRVMPAPHKRAAVEALMRGNAAGGA